jgi:hypothetical protein
MTGKKEAKLGETAVGSGSRDDHQKRGILATHLTLPMVGCFRHGHRRQRRSTAISRTKENRE